MKGIKAVKYQAVFKRYEIKYRVTEEQRQAVLRAMEPYMSIDDFGLTTIRNLYFDTDDYVLARHSIAKPDFKEKLRIRSYARASSESTVFMELKRKYDGVVYKRRVGLTESEADSWTAGKGAPLIHKEQPQLAAEIDYFLALYGDLKPVVYLSYDREAYRMKDGSDFRVTFDSRIKARDYDISLESDVYGTDLIEEGEYLMEIKCSGGIPLWMTEVLSAEGIYKTSFSKYGTAYQRMIYPALNTGHVHSFERAEQRTGGREKWRTYYRGYTRQAQLQA